jgi:hypothetical protein
MLLPSKKCVMKVFVFKLSISVPMFVGPRTILHAAVRVQNTFLKLQGLDVVVGFLNFDSLFGSLLLGTIEREVLEEGRKCPWIRDLDRHGDGRGAAQGDGVTDGVLRALFQDALVPVPQLVLPGRIVDGTLPLLDD